MIVALTVVLLLSTVIALVVVRRDGVAASRRMMAVVDAVRADGQRALEGQLIGNRFHGSWRHKGIIVRHHHSRDDAGRSSDPLLDVLTSCAVSTPFYFQGMQRPALFIDEAQLAAARSLSLDLAGPLGERLCRLAADPRFCALKTEPSARISNVTILPGEPGEHQLTHLGLRLSLASADREAIDGDLARDLDGAFLATCIDLLVELSATLRGSR